MTSERWEQINAAFCAVLDQEPADRAQHLDKAFAHDASLRDEVTRLLRDAQAAESQGFLQAPAWIIDDIPLFLPDFKNGDSEYSRIEYIGHGGMGIVYKAYHNNIDKWVALKLSSPAHLITSMDRDRFRTEAQSMARLRHPNIVTVHATGEYEGRPYFVMELIEGSSLNDRLSEYIEQPSRAAELVEAVALAVHHAHQRRILHNDLKPANILLDEEGKPHVSDFGLARRLEEGATPPASEAIEGTASYMSPERIEGKEITTASDVYGLGAILYALLTGRPPFRGETVHETLQMVRQDIPALPRTLNPNVDGTLEAICLKCLRKDKAQRYASANGLAQDLARYQANKETTAQPWNRRERFAAWCQRSRVEARLVTAVVAVWIFAVVMAVSVAQTRKADLLNRARTSASSSAKDVATTALLQLRLLSGTAKRAAADRALADLLASSNREGMYQYLRDACSGQPSPFETCLVLDRKGVIVARVRSAQPDLDDLIDKEYLGKSYPWRDYFQGAAGRAGAGDVYISRVYSGESDSLYKFAIAAPLLDNKGEFLGVFATSVTTDATMGLVYLHDQSREVALIAPRDPNNTPEGAPESGQGKYIVLFHPSYRRGIEAIGFLNPSRIMRVPEEPVHDQLQLPDPKLFVPPEDDYRDPVSSVAPDYEGRWIAGSAPVGKTGFVVIVQQRFEEAVNLELSTFWNLALWSALVSFVVVASLVMVLRQWTRSRRLRVR